MVVSTASELDIQSMNAITRLPVTTVGQGHGLVVSDRASEPEQAGIDSDGEKKFSPTLNPLLSAPCMDGHRFRRRKEIFSNVESPV